MADLLLVRHGETEWSRSHQHTSWTDVPLTPRGEQQARSLRQRLAVRKIGLILVSPMERAVRTARLAGLEDLTVEPDLREWDYGGYEGITTDEVHRTRPDWDLWTDGVPPGGPDHPGESPEGIGARVDRVLARIAPELAAADGADVVLVAHAHVLRVLTARRLGLPPSAGALFRLDTATVSRLGTEHGRPAMVAWNVGSESISGQGATDSGGTPAG
ncbi:histidine phosphatase family protein [Streptomyces samsunensis]|uniref:Histidine phosphatase family protein n=1 Tax=Streptomyces autolyticus TaxID=75293 RepID=A0ABN4W3L6_9ACTN|nr:MULTISPECIES: histidine phosphatase family protein [Streptomyces]MYU16418.1 histidine phosphatase family protein [Streptomyces sp. SID8361]AQA11663.1 histidine phosphatase family protein [Streptomyces autolyticus]ATL82647.1 phosphoglycerate mutase [Streptomyces malaysiensis]MCC4317778.1 histidine phosphatase family protein [Streptomyces malaysiensis]MCD9588990.1 histidine phosphatase family protein [Streptomyces sp. 8ZJF_21]